MQHQHYVSSNVFVFNSGVHPVGQSISGKHMVLNTSLMVLKIWGDHIADKTDKGLAACSIILWWHNCKLIQIELIFTGIYTFGWWFHLLSHWQVCSYSHFLAGVHSQVCPFTLLFTLWMNLSLAIAVSQWPDLLSSMCITNSLTIAHRASGPEQVQGWPPLIFVHPPPPSLSRLLPHYICAKSDKTWRVCQFFFFIQTKLVSIVYIIKRRFRILNTSD